MIKILSLFGTRPEAIKMAPLVKALNQKTIFDAKVCVTAQHREMLDQVLDFFSITPDYDLNLMRPNQNLYTLTADIITSLKPILEEFKPNYVLVHGDTTTSMAGALAAFYAGSKVCHIEAGLRTHNINSPFPEELNRQITGRISTYHFAPTEFSKENLIKENVKNENIIVTGNTVIDALFEGREILKNYSNSEIEELKSKLNLNKKIILVTGHRRENHGQGIIDICKALKNIAEKYKDDVEIVYPVHLNPNILNTVNDLLRGISNIKLVSPLSYPSFVWLMNQSYFILTDSGGIQEEAPSLGKPVLVMRGNTERPEAVDAGTVKLVGTDIDKIISNSSQLLDDSAYYASIQSIQNPYGDGKASERIINFLKNKNG
ncbi:UDP-N-acetylglucosamine 2-epimerase (non-hydrolyzing) [Ornithobacterium rhinotracheale]|uniref:non-hydrolyzing UDP-N-acetylglucosamine 2-epimerase n=1 Tax=Ornithobacterium rhinotracheale TaxID=28251 RepID=UPI00129C8204|nr:UDP-N-acetylglucosamine 2-epimerase (non-hydrolyzing) [Ornithobacterium rhinotracheale]MRJ07506.1 UDP-N-acetylglucosamine 2-epimerase (non-hydrolyzing) [Ornithobacterium rhinotracheale]UOH78100.1 UDP-N-acetylglucosamine 2-epimerase (non-hydrolyzing) [Ornithobacterium rhinotracheale]